MNPKIPDDANDSDDVSSNNSANPRFRDILGARIHRRVLLGGAAGVALLAGIAGPGLFRRLFEEDDGNIPDFDFEEIGTGFIKHHAVASGYNADVLIRWGDPVLADAPSFDPSSQSAAAQALQFGYNNDFTGYISLDNGDSSSPDGGGLLVVNHEYTSKILMFPRHALEQEMNGNLAVSEELANIEMMAHGGSVIEIKLQAGKWRLQSGSPYNRRITAETVMAISGPCAGHPRMATSYDPSGVRVRGMLNNCAGGMTPWDTWLSAEENINMYFWNRPALEGHAEQRNFQRMGIPAQRKPWGRFHDRFDIGKEPNESNRFGWIVEIDPLDPGSMPIKRTALGRFKHEGAESIVNHDGRVVIYMGDDQQHDYVYKFVTLNAYLEGNPEHNRNLLDQGTLHVAKFEDDGSVQWMPLEFGTRPLTEDNDFHSQADVLIETRRAADLLGATKMDRPEDVQPNPKSGKVYISLTNNPNRSPKQINRANPRAPNYAGHIIEITPHDNDHASTRATWDMLVLCGNPDNPQSGATFNSRTSDDGWFAGPDNFAVDHRGRLWVVTDGNKPETTGRTDGIWTLQTHGTLRGTAKHFFQSPIGAEVCGPTFTADDQTLFASIQHPGAGSSFDQPSTRWPDFDSEMPPRPAVIAITRIGGGKIA